MSAVYKNCALHALLKQSLSDICTMRKHGRHNSLFVRLNYGYPLNWSKSSLAVDQTCERAQMKHLKCPIFKTLRDADKIEPLRWRTCRDILMRENFETERIRSFHRRRREKGAKNFRNRFWQK